MKDPTSPFDELLSAYLDGELTDAMRQEVEQRLTSDPAYRQAWDELRALSASFAALPEHRLPADFADRVLRRAERQMLTEAPVPAAAERESAPVAAVPSTAIEPAQPAMRAKWDWQRWKRPAAFAAIAAGIALMVSLFEGGPWFALQQAEVGRNVAMDDKAHLADETSIGLSAPGTYSADLDVPAVNGRPTSASSRPMAKGDVRVSERDAAASQPVDTMDRSELARGATAQRWVALGGDDGLVQVTDEAGAVEFIQDGQRQLQRSFAWPADSNDEVRVITANVSSSEIDQLLLANDIQVQTVSPNVGDSREQPNFGRNALGFQVAAPPAASGGTMIYYVVAPEAQMSAVIDNLRGRGNAETAEAVLPTTANPTEKVVNTYVQSMELERRRSQSQPGNQPRAEGLADPYERQQAPLAADDSQPAAPAATEPTTAPSGGAALSKTGAGALAADKPEQAGITAGTVPSADGETETLGLKPESSDRRFNVTRQLGQAQRWYFYSGVTPLDGGGTAVDSPLEAGFGANRYAGETVVPPPTAAPPVAQQQTESPTGAVNPQRTPSSSATMQRPESRGTASAGDNIDNEQFGTAAGRQAEVSEHDVRRALRETGQQLQRLAEGQNNARRKGQDTTYSEAFILVPAIAAPPVPAAGPAPAEPSAPAATTLGEPVPATPPAAPMP